MRVELMAVLDGLLQNLDALRIRQMHKLCIDHALQTPDESLVYHIVQELQIIGAVFKCPAYTILDEILFKFHQFIQVHEADFRLNHPKL